MQAVQREREENLARKLRDFLYHFVRGDKEGFLRQAKSEAQRLSQTGENDNQLPLLSSLNGSRS